MTTKTNFKRFVNKVAFVTGASRGIGQGVALAFAREGAHVVSADIGDPSDTIMNVDGGWLAR
jgi:NAD(P)-dependent dehydrogenase (short-subunit alcohol dehydrogenase family)